MKRDFISILDWTTGEILDNIDFAIELKQKTKEGMCPKLLEGKNYGIFFHKPSLRTRLSFEVGITQLGGSSMVLSEQDFKIGERETVSDVARVMSRYVDGILIRTFSHQMVLDLAKHASVPVINMLTDYNHPCQLMSDVLTIKEKLGRIDNLRIAYLGDSNNMTVSWLNLAGRIPLDLRIGTSPETMPDMKLVNEIKELGISTINITNSALLGLIAVAVPLTLFIPKPGRLSIKCSPGKSNIVVFSTKSLSFPLRYENLADSISALCKVLNGFVNELP